MTAPRVLFYVQYLEGIGHVVRASRIAEALEAAGASVTLVLGGPPLSGVVAAGIARFQLPPVQASASSYSRLVKSDGTPVSDADMAERRRLLRDIYDDVAPDVVITEAYPMGRWAMNFELEPLLAHVRTGAGVPRPLVLASLRDILQMPKSADKAAKSAALFARYYDAMLIHGDPRLVRVEESFPPLRPFLDRGHYTGLVLPPVKAVAAPVGACDVVVSAGGGAIAAQVIETAIRAKPATRLADAKWLALAGPRMADDEFHRLTDLARTYGVGLERFRDDLAGLLRGARVSIQRAGYNSVADLLVSGRPAVLVPDSAENQMEQPLRASKLAAMGRAVVVDEEALSETTMALAVHRAVDLRPGPVDLATNGAARSAEIVFEL